MRTIVGVMTPGMRLKRSALNMRPVASTAEGELMTGAVVCFRSFVAASSAWPQMSASPIVLKISRCARQRFREIVILWGNGDDQKHASVDEVAPRKIAPRGRHQHQQRHRLPRSQIGKHFHRPVFELNVLVVPVRVSRRRVPKKQSPARDGASTMAGINSQGRFVVFPRRCRIFRRRPRGRRSVYELSDGPGET